MTDAARSKYQWPGSRLGEKEMALLFQEKQKTKQSICELLRRAVHTAYGEAADTEISFVKSKKEVMNDC